MLIKSSRLVTSYLISILFFVSCTNTSSEEADSAKTTDSSSGEEMENVESDIEIENVYAFDPEYSKRALVRMDNIIWLYADMAKDYRIFGYAEPSKESEKMFLLSVFTDDVEENPLGCKYGAYYESARMDDEGISLKYVGDTLGFSKIAILKNQSTVDFAYVATEWLEFEKP